MASLKKSTKDTGSIFSQPLTLNSLCNSQIFTKQSATEEIVVSFVSTKQMMIFSPPN